MFDLIAIGDAALDLFFKINDAHLELDKDTPELCLRFGDKLPVEQFIQSLGGNASNNAVGTARLGLRTAVYLNVGTDLNGKFTLAKLKEEGVDTRYIKVSEGMNSNVSALITFKGERTILTFRQKFRYQLPDLDKTRWIYLSSIGESAIKDNLIKQIENYLERTNTPLVYNPGPYELNFGVKKFPKLLSLTKLLILNKEEAREVLEKNQKENLQRRSKIKNQNLKKMLISLVELGPKMVIITDGKNGSYAFDGEAFWRIEAFPVKVVDMTGAGDAYGAGVVAGLFYGKDLPEAMRWGAANGAAQIEIVGTQIGMLTYDMMQKMLKENSKIVAKELR